MTQKIRAASLVVCLLLMPAASALARMPGASVQPAPAVSRQACESMRAAIITRYWVNNDVDARIREYRGWRARSWHAAYLAKRQYDRVRKLILDTPEGKEATRLIQIPGTRDGNGYERPNYESMASAAKFFTAAWNKVHGGGQLKMTCPKGTSAKASDPGELSREDLTFDERLQHDDRLRASRITWTQLREGYDHNYNAIVGWCQVDAGAENAGDLRFPEQWVDVEVRNGNSWGESYNIRITAFDATHAPKNPNGSLKSPAEIDKLGYSAWLNITMKDLLLWDPTVDEILEHTRRPPQELPSEDDIRRELPSNCSSTALLGVPDPAIQDEALASLKRAPEPDSTTRSGKSRTDAAI